MNNIYNQPKLLQRAMGEVKVNAKSTFDILNSKLKDNIFVWLYHIKVDNYTPEHIKLVGGKWEIFDKYGKAELEDRSLIDNPYIIKAEQSLECTNIIKLYSDSGLIYGKYFFQTLESNKEFSVNIEIISLDNITEGRIAN